MLSLSNTHFLIPMTSLASHHGDCPMLCHKHPCTSYPELQAVIQNTFFSSCCIFSWFPHLFFIKKILFTLWSLIQMLLQYKTQGRISYKITSSIEYMCCDREWLLAAVNKIKLLPSWDLHFAFPQHVAPVLQPLECSFLWSLQFLEIGYLPLQTVSFLRERLCLPIKPAPPVIHILYSYSFRICK